MSSYMNRCPTCGCTDETRIMRSEYDQRDMMCARMLAFIRDLDLDHDPIAYPIRTWIMRDAEEMGIVPLRPPKQVAK